MRQKPNDAIVAWAQDLAAQGIDPNAMMQRLLKAGWLFDSALGIMQPHFPEWVARQTRQAQQAHPSAAAATGPSVAQRLHQALGVPQK